MQHNFHINNNDLAALDEVAKKLLSLFPAQKKFALYGEIGTGKTTFTKAVCRVLGTDDTVSSPTYSIVNEYLMSEGGFIRHIDLYRLRTPEEALDINIEEYLYDEYYCFVEWAELVEDWLPEDIVRLRFETQEDESRRIIAETVLAD